MGGNRVLIVGVSARALAESASRVGYRCVSVDAFGDLDQKERVESLGLRRDLGRPYSAAAAVAVGRRFAVNSAAYLGNLENHPSAVRRLAEGRELLGNSPATLARVRDFTELARVVRAAGGHVPLTLPPGENGPLPPGREWLVKPARGGGGSGVRRFAPGGAVGSGAMVQERVEGTLASAAFVADGRRAALLGLARGLAGDPAFAARGHRYCGSLYPFSADGVLVARLDALVQAITRAFGLVGVNGLDFVLREGKAFVLEVNPRYSASMELIERGGRLSVFETHVAGCGGALPSPPSLEAGPPAKVLGKAVLWARRDLVTADTRGWLARDDVRDVPFPGGRIRRGHPICTVFANATDSTTCYRRLVAAAEALEKEISGAPAGAHR